jgi:SAM-dependent methyltransferase
MKSVAIRLLRQWVLPFVDPRRIASAMLLPVFLRDWWRYRRASPHEHVTAADLFPCLMDRVEVTPFDAHYFFQASWLARRLAASRPAYHVDVGSSVSMIAVISAFAPTVFVDYRPLPVRLENLDCVAGSLARLPFPDDRLSSLSCLHVVEHVGLGRYGDPLNPAGSADAARELQRVLAPGGRLFLATPVGRERVCFNAHRVFDPGTVRQWFTGLTLKEFSCVTDGGVFMENAPLRTTADSEYALGLFVFEK